MTRCRLLLLADERGEPAGREIVEVIPHLLERRRRGALLELVHRVEAQLRLATLGRGRAVEVGCEPGQIRPGEADLRLPGAHQRQVSRGIVRLERGAVLGLVVDHGHQRGARRRALVAGLDGDHAEEPTGGEALEVVTHRFEPRRGHALLERVHVVEVELRLPIERGLLAVERAGELGELRLGEADLLLLRAYQGQVLLRVVLLERGRALGLLVDDGHDRLRGRRCRGGGRGGRSRVGRRRFGSLVRGLAAGRGEHHRGNQPHRGPSHLLAPGYRTAIVHPRVLLGHIRGTALPPYRLTALPPYRLTARPPYRHAG